MGKKGDQLKLMGIFEMGGGVQGCQAALVMQVGVGDPRKMGMAGMWWVLLRGEVGVRCWRHRRTRGITESAVATSHGPMEGKYKGVAWEDSANGYQVLFGDTVVTKS